MTIQCNTIPKKSAVKFTLSTISLSALLALSACSGGDNTAAEAPAETSDTEAVVVEPEASTEVAEVVTEPSEAPEPIDTAVEEVIETEEVVTDVEPEVLAADAGAKLYASNCKVCHDAGLLNAPKYGDQAAWEPRLAKGIDTLRMHSAQGFNKMPAQANDTVSEAQVYAAVDYMVAAVS